MVVQKQTAKATTALKPTDLGFKVIRGLVTPSAWNGACFFGWSECGTLLLGCLENRHLTRSLWRVNCPQSKRKGSSDFISACKCLRELQADKALWGVRSSIRMGVMLWQRGLFISLSLLNWCCPHICRDHVSLSTKEEQPPQKRLKSRRQASQSFPLNSATNQAVWFGASHLPSEPQLSHLQKEGE